MAEGEVYVGGGTFDQFGFQRLYAGRHIPFRLNDLEDVDPALFKALRQPASVAHRALADATWLFETLIPMSS